MVKKKNEFFHQVYNAEWDLYVGHKKKAASYFNASVWKQLFSGSCSSNLPVTSVEQHRTVWSSDGKIGICLKLRASGPRGSRKHRVFTKCYRCGKDVQAGRIAQHRC